MSYRVPHLDLFTTYVKRSPLAAAADDLRGHPRRVYMWILGRGTHGGTRAEAAASLGILDQSLGTVFGDLVNLGLIEDTGDTRVTSSGRSARVFVAVQEKTA